MINKYIIASSLAPCSSSNDTGVDTHDYSVLKLVLVLELVLVLIAN
jgi:hypothetical protein